MGCCENRCDSEGKRGLFQATRGKWSNLSFSCKDKHLSTISGGYRLGGFWVLSPARLPIPPLRHMFEQQISCFCQPSQLRGALILD